MKLRATPTKTHETKLQSAIIVALNAIPGVKAMKNAKGSRGNIQLGLLSPGSSDVIVCACGRFGALEVKLPLDPGVTAPSSSKASDEQEAFIDEIHRCGGFGCVVRSVEEAVAEVIAVVESVERGRGWDSLLP